MGQLEKYGLYVLCLVIFLILGVAIWGGDAVPAYASTNLPGTSVSEPRSNPVVAAQRPLDVGDDGFGDLFAPAQLPKSEPQPVVTNLQPQGQPQSQGQATPLPVVAPKEQPAPTPAPAPAPSDRERSKYKVKASDTLTTIATKQLGDVRLVKEIERLNPKVNASKMPVGTELVLPSRAEVAQWKQARDSKVVAEATAKKAEVAKTDGKVVARTIETPKNPLGTRLYKVRPKDTLEGIARKLYGTPRRVDEIRQLNPKLDPGKLPVNAEILVPER